MLVNNIHLILTLSQEIGNSLMVRFCPIKCSKYACDQPEEQGYAVPPECLESIQDGECHVNHILRIQASFPWSITSEKFD